MPLSACAAPPDGASSSKSDYSIPSPPTAIPATAKGRSSDLYREIGMPKRLEPAEGLLAEA